MDRVEHFSLCVDLILNAGSRGTCGSVRSRRWPGASLHDDSREGLEEGKEKMTEADRRQRDATA